MWMVNTTTQVSTHIQIYHHEFLNVEICLISTFLQAVKDKEETPKETGTLSTLTPSLFDDVDDVVSIRLPRGYTLLKIPRGGDCMFRALARLYYDAEDAHTKLRHQVVDYVVGNWERMKMSMGIIENTATKYKERMLNTKHVEIGDENGILFVAARHLRRRITVLTIDATDSNLPVTKREYVPEHEYVPLNTGYDSSLCLVHVNKNHYHAGIHTYKLTRMFSTVHSFIFVFFH